MVLYKGDPESIQIGFLFNANTEILTLSLSLRMIYARESSIYASGSLVKEVNYANELAVCCVNNIGL